MKTNTLTPELLLKASVPDTLAALHVVAKIGLATNEVSERRKKYGYNEVPITKTHPLLVFLGKFWGMSAWMLELIILLSAVLGNIADLVVVSVLLVVNAVLSYTQERRATGVVEALRQRLQVSARVLRDATWQVIPSRELVPGDIVRLRSGDIIPADVKLLTGTLTIDQSSLTGESKDVDTVPGGVLSSGSIVRSGEGNGVVLVTGSKTYLGRTTELVQKAQPKLHIEIVIIKVVRWLFVIVGILLSVVIGLAWMHGLPLQQIAPLMLVLLMSAVPVALPVMFTVSMALGSKDLAKHGVLVTRLSAVEDAATMDVLCADKTGTITMNQLAVTGVIPVGDATEASVLYAGLLASKESNQDPIDLAFVAATKERGLYIDKPAVIKDSFVPFDAKNRRTEALVEQNGQRLRVMKGAVETITQLCGSLPPAIAALVETSSSKGYRTLAVAQGPDGGSLTLLGLVTLNDPPRPDAKQLIAELKDLGVSVKMLTGDALPVASAIGNEVGLPCIHRMADLKAAGEHTNPKEEDLLADVDGLAEVFPEDKYIVVQHLQAANHVTGMTGDGVNDAPALRQAEVGIAVSTATDVAKGAASVVLTESGLTNIVVLIGHGRAIYQRILTWIINKISRTILKAAYVSAAFVVTGQFVISAFVMLLLVFVTDFAVITLATDHVRPSKKPETWKIGGFVTVSVALGIAMLAETLLLLWIGWTYFGLSTNSSALNTFSFLLLLYFAVFSIISVRERSWFWATMPSTLFLSTLAAEAFAGTLLTYFKLPGLAPLLGWQALAIFGYAMIMCLGINDIFKVVMIKWLVLNRHADVSQGKANPPIIAPKPVKVIKSVNRNLKMDNKIIDAQLLIDTAKSLVSGDKGLLAIDESKTTCNKRFAALAIPQTEAARHDYRELIVTTPGLGESISGLILYDETIRQSTKDGTPFIKIIIDAGIIPGIKVDIGAKDMAGHPQEKITEGLDGLRERLAEYVQMGARFAKWRAVMVVDDCLPSRSCIEANAHALARYASLCQEAGLVPIIEPEVIMNGGHTLERCNEVTEEVLYNVFHQLYVQKVLLEGLILKPNMVLPGLACSKQATVDEVADATVKCLLRAVPAAVSGIVFLSGGQSAELASAHLNAMNARFKSRLPWPLSFSFSRAIQQPALDIWLGKPANVIEAQQALSHRAKCNQAARRGQYDTAMEHAPTRN